MLTPATIARLVSLETAGLDSLLIELAAILGRDANDRELEQVLNAMESVGEIRGQFNLRDLTLTN